MLIHDADITGSFLYNGVNISNVTGSAASLTALNQFSASINLFTGSYNTGSFTGSFIGNGSGLNGVVSASFASNARSASFASTATSSSYAAVATSASYAAVATSASQASNANTATSASQAANAVTSSYAANADLLDGIDSTRFAVTSSNTFTSTQYISATNNAVGFTSTASIYTDGGLRVTKDAYVSGTIFVNNLTVYGTQSINYITSSQLNIGTNIITVNTDTPAIRFGGLAVYDSGSTGLTGSMLWDSERNHWVYSNPSGSSYDGGMMISGPRNSSGLGSEQGTVNNAIMKGQGGDHITSSLITETGTATTFYTNALYVTSSNFVGIGTTSPSYNLDVSGTGRFTGALTGSSAVFSGAITANTTSIFSSAVNLSAIFSNGGAAGNYNAIELRGGTSGTAVNWQISKDNSTANAFELAPSTTAGGTTYGSPVFKIVNTGAATFASIVTFLNGNNTTDNIRFQNTDGNYAYIRQTSASNTNNVWYDATLGATMWYAYENPGQSRTAGLYTQHIFGTGRGSTNEAVTINRGTISGVNSSGSTTYTITKDGSATFSSSVTTGGNINANASSAAIQANGYQIAKYSYFGYSTGYPGVIIGNTGGQTLFFNVDVSGNSSGAFSGNGSEYVWRNAGSFITPNASNNGYNTLFSWNSSGQLTIPGALTVRNTSSTPSIWSGQYGGAISILGDNATSTRYIDLSIVDSTGALATQGIRLLNSGNVGIGTASPSSRLGVATSGADGAVLEQDLGDAGNSSRLFFKASGQTYGMFNNASDLRITYGASPGSTSGTSFAKFANTGKYFRMESGTGGIQFQGNTGAANALNYYEEGTWTPVISRLNSAPTVSYSYRDGTYTRIGNMVYVFFDISAASISGGSGYAIISGLPFTVNNNMAGYSVAQWRDSGAISSSPSNTVVKGFVNRNTNYIYIQIDYSGPSGFGNYDGAGWNGSGRATGYVIYQA